MRNPPVTLCPFPSTDIDTLRTVTYLPVGGVGGTLMQTGWELLDLWCRSMKARNFSRATITCYRRTVGMFLIWSADRHIPLETVTPNDVVDWLDSRSLGPRTRYAYTSALATFYRWSVREEHLPVDPTLRVDRPRLGRYLPRPAPLEIVMRALDCGDLRVVLMIACGAFAGMRRAEIASVRVEDLLLANDPPMILLHGKGGRERLVPLHDEILSALRAYGIPKTGWLFPSPTTGRGITPNYVGNLITAALTEAGGHISPHQLRHLFGTNSYAVCSDLRVVQELLGHASPATTAIYTAFSPVIAAQTVKGLPGRPLRSVPAA